MTADPLAAVYVVAAIDRRSIVETAWRNGATEHNDRVVLAAWHCASQEFRNARKARNLARKAARTGDGAAQKTLEAAERNYAVAKFTVLLIRPLGYAARERVSAEFAARSAAQP